MNEDENIADEGINKIDINENHYRSKNENANKNLTFEFGNENQLGSYQRIEHRNNNILLNYHSKEMS